MGRPRLLGLLTVTLFTVLVVPVSASSLTVTTTPDGQPVLLDGQPQGQSPAKLKLGSGEHQLKVTNGDTVWESRVRLKGQARLTLSLTGSSTRAPHRALVLSRPEGADVRINGTLRGTTPWSGELPAQARTIELLKDGYDTWSMTLTPSGDFSVRGTLKRTRSGAGESEANDSSSGSKVTRVMPVESDTPEASVPEADPDPDTREDTGPQPNVAADTTSGETTPAEEPDTVPLSLQSNPSGARVTINGETVGRTPIRRRVLEAGTAAISLSKPGYHDWEERIRIDTPTRLTVRLRRIKSTLLLRGTPDTMQVTVDGTTVRPETGKRIELAPGTYTITARAHDHESFDTTVALEPGSTRELTIELDPILHAWDFPATRDVFLGLGRNTLGELVETVGLEAGDRVKLVPAREDRSHALVRDVLSVVLNRKAMVVVDEPGGGPARSGNGPDTSPESLDGLLKVRVVEMDVSYEKADRKRGEDWTQRHFTMKLFAELVNPSGGEVQYSRYFTRTTKDTVPTRFRDALEKSYSPAD